MDSFVLLAYACLAASRTLSQWLLACLNFTLVQTRKVISMNYGSSKSSWKPWRSVRLDLLLMMRDKYINSNLNPLKKFTSSSNSTEFKDILPRNFPQMIMKTVPISTRIVISYAIKQGIPPWIWWKVSGTDPTTWSEFPNEWKACVEQILASEGINKSKRAGLWESQSGIQVGKLTVWVRSFEIIIIRELTRPISSPKIS